MLSFNALLACIFGPTSLVAILAWWWDPRLKWESIGVLASGAGIVVYLPLRTTLFPPPGAGFDGFGGIGFEELEIMFEFLLVAGFLGLIHVWWLFALFWLGIENVIERRKATRKSEKSRCSSK